MLDTTRTDRAHELRARAWRVRFRALRAWIAMAWPLVRCGFCGRLALRRNCVQTSDDRWPDAHVHHFQFVDVAPADHLKLVEIDEFVSSLSFVGTTGLNGERLLLIAPPASDDEDDRR